jgi:uncharacterized protein (TIRG00374 family)
VSRAWRLLLALVGTALLVAMVWVIGPGVIADGMREAGWWLLPILALHALVYGLNALAWWVALPPTSDRPSLGSAFRISVVGFAMNFVTPIVNAGGEPYRIAALAPTLGTARATGVVLLYVLIHAVSSLLLWLTAIVLALTTLDLDAATRTALGVALVLVLAALSVVLAGQRGGVVVRLARPLERVRLRTLSAWLAGRREGLATVDAELVRTWHERPRALVAAVGLDTLARIAGAGEFLLVAHALGIPLAPSSALLMWGLLALAMNLFFLFPWELGSREGSIVAVSALAGMPVSFTGLAMVAGRLRELSWAAVGMAVLWWESRHAVGRAN